jgi:hypothetical protein
MSSDAPGKHTLSLDYDSPGQEGLTAEEVVAARSGGLDPQPARGVRADPLLRGVVAYASLSSPGGARSARTFLLPRLLSPWSDGSGSHTPTS